jgi:hypothetical protein
MEQYLLYTEIELSHLNNKILEQMDELTSELLEKPLKLETDGIINILFILKGWFFAYNYLV